MMWLFGGLGENSAGKVQVYDPASDKWQRKATIPYGAAGSANAVVIQNSIYVCGGLILDEKRTTKECAQYDPAKGEWFARASMPFPVHHAGAGTDGNRMFVFGGRDTNKNRPAQGVSKLQIYDPGTDSWTLGPNMLIARSGMGASPFLFGKFYIIGGEEKKRSYSNNDKVFPQVHTYDVATGMYEEAPEMPSPVHGAFPVADTNIDSVGNGRIYVFGGGSVAGDSTTKLFQTLEVPGKIEDTSERQFDQVACVVVRTRQDVATLACPEDTLISSVDYAMKGVSEGRCGAYNAVEGGGGSVACPVNVAAFVSAICTGKNLCPIAATDYIGFGCSLAMLTVQVTCALPKKEIVQNIPLPCGNGACGGGASNGESEMTFAAVDNGGCCRTEDDGSGDFEKTKDISYEACKVLCEGTVGCIGLEYKESNSNDADEPYDGASCEVHFTPIAFTEPNGFCSDFKCYSAEVITTTAAVTTTAQEIIEASAALPMCNIASAPVLDYQAQASDFS
jgi:hypothetical protein